MSSNWYFSDAVVAVACHPTENIIATGALGADCSIRIWRDLSNASTPLAPPTVSRVATHTATLNTASVEDGPSVAHVNGSIAASTMVVVPHSS